MVLDRPRLVAQRVELGQAGDRARAVTPKVGLDHPQRLAQMGVGKRGRGVVLEALARDLHLAASADGRRIGHAGQHFGDVTGFDGSALAAQAPADVEEAAEIAG